MTSAGYVAKSTEHPFPSYVTSSVLLGALIDALTIEPEGSAPTFLSLSLGAFGLLLRNGGADE